jgi:hypothetical protein
MRTHHHKPRKNAFLTPRKVAIAVGKAAVWVIVLIVGAAITLLATFHLFPSVASYFLRQPVLMMATQFNHEPLYDCGSYSISLVPTSSIKSLDVLFHFDQPIHDVFLTRGMHSDPLRPGISGNLSLGSPCNFLTKSADPNQALTFTISSDRRGITIRGRDISLFDSQMFSVTFYPDYEKGEPDTTVTARATYEKDGLEFPAKVGLYDAWTKGYTILSQ